MKRLSQKDLIIALGIAVAAIILASSLYFSDSSAQSEHRSAKPIPAVKSKPTILIKKVLDRFATRANL